MLELIDMESRTEGVIEGLIKQCERKGFGKGRKSFIDLLLKSHSIEQVAGLLEMPLEDVVDIFEK